MKHLAHRIIIYLKLYACYTKLNLIKNINYRINFIIGILINLVGSLVLFYFYDVVFEKVDILGTWNKSHAMILVGSYIIVESLYIGLSFHSLSLLPKIIVEGELDHYLIRPISTRASLILQEVDFGNVLNSLLGIGLIYYYSPSSSVSFYAIASYIAAIGLGFFFLSSVLFFLMSLTFWLGRIDELRDMLAWIIELGSKPAFVYPKILRNIFYWILPFFLMANVPTEFLRGERHNIFVFFVSILPFYFLSQFVWRLGLKRYVSASR